MNKRACRLLVGCRYSLRHDKACVGDSRWDAGDDLRGAMSNG